MLSVFWDAITTELAALNAYAVPQQGEQFYARNDPGPTMIFVELDDAIGPPEGPGGNPKPLFTILERTELILRGATRDIVQGMRDQFLVALHKATKKAGAAMTRAGRYVVGKGVWAKGTIIGRNGFEYRLPFAIAYPVVARTWEALEVPGPDADATTYPTVPGDELTIAGSVGIAEETAADDPELELVLPVLVTVDPDAVDVAGGELVELTGTGLLPLSSLEIDGEAVEATTSSATTITFTMPATAAGSHDVTVTTPNGTSNVLAIVAS